MKSSDTCAYLYVLLHLAHTHELDRMSRTPYGIWKALLARGIPFEYGAARYNGRKLKSEALATSEMTIESGKAHLVYTLRDGAVSRVLERIEVVHTLATDGLEGLSGREEKP